MTLKRIRRIRPVLALAFGLLLAWSPAFRAHDEGVLKPATKSLTAGDTLTLAGEKFEGEAALTLVLVGVDGRVELGQVRTDTAGAFAVRLLIPGEVNRGAYRLVAVADDGDEAASVEVTVEPRMSGEGNAAVHAERPPPAMSDDPSAAPLQLKRARSGLVTTVAVAGIVLALAVAGALLRTRRLPDKHERTGARAPGTSP